MSKTLIRAQCFLLAAMIGAPQVASAQEGNVAEAVRNKQEMRRNRRQSKDDRVDFKRLKAIAKDWRDAVRSKNSAKEKAADARLAAWLKREMREERREGRQAEAERRQARRERDRSRREAKRSKDGDDRRDLRDDRRDLKDDRRDARYARRDKKRLRGLMTRLAKIQPAFTAGTATRAQYKEKGQILKALLRGEKREIRKNRKEVREDRRERREDARERREDRRKRKKTLGEDREETHEDQ